MAKAESGLRQRIKAALEADGWSVVTQHGSAYSPNIPDLLVVLAALEVKTETGVLEPGQRNRIRRFRKEGIPAGIVRSVEEARQGMRLVRQGAYQVTMTDNPQAPVVDMSFLQGILAQSEPEPQPAPAAAPEPAPEPPQTLTELMGMQGSFETFEPTPAADPEPETTQAAVEYRETARPMVDAYQSVLKQAGPQPAVETQDTSYANAPVLPQYSVHALPQGMGLLEEVVFRLRHIDETLSALVAGFGGGSQGTVPAQPQGEQPVRRRRRTKAEMEAAAAAGEQDPEAAAVAKAEATGVE